MKANQRSFIEQLLAQEPPLTNEQYLAYRARVSEGIRRARKQERTVRIVTQSVWALVGLVMIADATVDFNRDTVPEAVRLWLIAPTMISIACAVAFLVIYLVNYRPRLKDAEQQVLLLSLQRQLFELQSQLQQNRRRPGAGSQNEPAPGE